MTVVAPFCAGSLFCGVVLNVLSSLAIILMRKRERGLPYLNDIIAVR